MKANVQNHLNNLLETISNTAEAGHEARLAYARLSGAVDALIIADSITLEEAKHALTRGNRAMKEG